MSNDAGPLLVAFVACHFPSRIMEILHYLCLLILHQVAVHEVSSKHVHLKIFVPDVVNHHVHTRTVLLHLHMPAPKKVEKPKTQPKQVFHSNWSSWSYGRHQEIDDEHEDPELDHENHHEDQVKQRPVDEKRHRQKYFPVHDYHKDSYLPQHFVDDNEVEQKDRGREGDSYAVHEDVNDIPPNSEHFTFNYEEGYRKGLETESGHVRSDQMTKFHEDRQEEQGDAEGDGFNEEFETKADSGRYLVDDVEYENNTRDKREPSARRRRVRKSRT